MDRKEKQLRYCEAGLFAEKVLSIIDDSLGRYANIDRLHRAGVNVLSSGVYGTTMLSPDGEWVLKVCWDKHDAYPIYARWAAANPGPHIPEIFYQVQTEHLYICAMPRYYETKLDSYEYLSDCRDIARYNAPMDTDPSLAKAIRKMLDALEDFCSADMHYGNFMYDPKRRQYVVTDPFSSLCIGKEAAVARVTGTEYKPQLVKQLDIFDQQEPELPTPTDLRYLEHVCQVAGEKIHRAAMDEALAFDFNKLEQVMMNAFANELKVCIPVNGVIKL